MHEAGFKRRQPHSLPDTSLLLYSLQVLFWPLCPAVQWKDKEVVLVVLVVLPSSTRFQHSSLVFAKSWRRQYLGCWHEKIIEQDKDNLAIFSNSSSVSECILKSLLSRERRKCWNGWNQSQSSFLSASFSTQIWAKRERQRISKQSWRIHKASSSSTYSELTFKVESELQTAFQAAVLSIRVPTNICDCLCQKMRQGERTRQHCMETRLKGGPTEFCSIRELFQHHNRS